MANNETLALGDNVRLTSADPAAPATLRWAANTGVGPTVSLIGAVADIEKGRYAVEDLTIAVETPCLFVIDVLGVSSFASDPPLLVVFWVESDRSRVV